MRQQRPAPPPEGEPPGGGIEGGAGPAGVVLRRWSDRAVIGVAVIAAASGFGQFGVMAALGDVGRTFGQVVHGSSIADQAGLSGTQLGVGLAVIRLASLAGLPMAGFADRLGRRSMLLLTVVTGLLLTALAALSPTYWWFVVIFACARPALNAANVLAQLSAAELTASRDRTKAIALVSAGYGVGAGLTAILHSLGLNGSSFRILFALALVPLVVIIALSRWVREPDRFVVSAARAPRVVPVLGAIAPRFRRRLGVVVVFAFAVSVITGPADSFVFLYAQNIVHQAGAVTAGMVAVAGVAGLVGLNLGRWLADRLGRRPTGAIGILGLAGFDVMAYSGPTAALIAGYILGVLAGSVLAPALGALINELFPTSVRASVAGWWVGAGVAGATVGLLLFGALADLGNRFFLSAAITFLPVSAAAAVLWLAPETRGREPEQIAGW